MQLGLAHHIRAKQPLIWLRTSEYEDAIQMSCNEISANFPDKFEVIKRSLDMKTEDRMVDQKERIAGFDYFRWDTAEGLVQLVSFKRFTFGLRENLPKPEERLPAFPLNQIRSWRRQPAVVFLLDYHEFINTVAIWRQMQNLYNFMKDNKITIVIVSPTVSIPPEITDYFTVVEYGYPDARTLAGYATAMAQANSCLCDDLDLIVSTGRGMTRIEFRRALEASVANTNPRVISWRYVQAAKEARVAKEPFIKLLPSTAGFDSLVGMNALKKFTRPMALSGRGRGVLLLGVPGTGKSAFAATLGYETGRTTLTLDFGSLMGGLVGETEKNTDRALRFIDAMSPCILFIDEIEKGLAGTSGYNGDAGTARRQGSAFLKWLNDHKTDVFVIATANSITDLPPEYKRAGRWDAIFFIDTPTPEQARQIFQYHANRFQLRPTSPPPTTTTSPTLQLAGLTGAEIEELCRIASTLQVSPAEASLYIKPITEQMDVQALRDLAKSCAIMAS